MFTRCVSLSADPPGVSLHSAVPMASQISRSACAVRATGESAPGLSTEGSSSCEISYLKVGSTLYSLCSTVLYFPLLTLLCSILLYSKLICSALIRYSLLFSTLLCFSHLCSAPLRHSDHVRKRSVSISISHLNAQAVWLGFKAFHAALKCRAGAYRGTLRFLESKILQISEEMAAADRES